MKQDAGAVFCPEGSADDPVRGLDPRVVWRWRGHWIGCVVLASLALGSLAAHFPVVAPPALASTTLAIGLPDAWVVPALRYRFWSYRFEAGGLWLRRGVWHRVTSVVVDTAGGAAVLENLAEDVAEEWGLRTVARVGRGRSQRLGTA